MSDDYEARKRLTENVLGDADWAVDQIMELRAEVERLKADNARIQRIAHAAGVIDLIHAERALADQLAEALQGHPHKSAIPNDEEWAITVAMRRAALAKWEAARHE